MITPYIGRQVSHFEGVDIGSIKANFSECKRYRYTLDLRFKKCDKRDKHLSIILKNPSSADEFKADKTIATAQRYIYEHFLDVASLSVLNIFAYRATLAKDIATLLREKGALSAIGEENDAYIKDRCAKADFVLVAWGGSSGINQKAYTKRVDEVFGLLKGLKKPIFRNPKKGSELFPFHACYWDYATSPIEMLLS